ncbi:hypothetical protein JKP88DRAFT_163276 [Tribonema minus]|uniref:C2 domain-containing protein n=1 Tax=Tribonema minus TaxID=303371 RepID=A0A835YYX7_9STRA|nr:hypothetical protein JKP88DRAFT_163276 [Tribonema minus]
MPSSQVQLSISCAGLVNMDQGSLSDPFVVLKRKEPRGGAWVEVARTEIVANNLNPAWAKLITVDYMFEEVQYLRFEVYDAGTAVMAI